MYFMNDIDGFSCVMDDATCDVIDTSVCTEHKGHLSTSPQLDVWSPLSSSARRCRKQELFAEFCDVINVENMELIDRPPSPVNVTVTQLKANSATVSWDVPEGDIIIGYAISQQRQDGQMQRFIREVNTTNRACVLWDLEEDTDYIIQVQSIGLYSESQASTRVHFRTLKETDRLPSNSSNQGDITVEGVDKERHLETGEIIIIVVVLLMWAGE
ncbi:hypothetical protein NDU88_011391 [Pleurodeles waltl]|uniref:Fibronectin type-III domain-containing protein n=1 Tax=Pleurodeles waltl TaxID=8319 RepID=A0AAV7S6R0_PLEWA|nr:hypothetical protein NDU88_011391 [Pleurodeles waltl]